MEEPTYCISEQLSFNFNPEWGVLMNLLKLVLHSLTGWFKSQHYFSLQMVKWRNNKDDCSKIICLYDYWTQSWSDT